MNDDHFETIKKSDYVNFNGFSRWILETDRCSVLQNTQYLDKLPHVQVPKHVSMFPVFGPF